MDAIDFPMQISAMLWQLVEALNFDDENDLVPSLFTWLRDHFHEPVGCKTLGLHSPPCLCVRVCVCGGLG